MEDHLSVPMPATAEKAGAPVMERPQIDAITLLAFAALVVIAAGNFVAVRFITVQMPSFWGAGTRFGAASLIFFAYALVKRLPMPRGRALVGALIYGGLQFGISFALGYFALRELSAGLGSVLFAAVPMFTILFAYIARLERLQWRSILGSFIVLAGILFIYREQIGLDVPPANLLAMLGMVVSISLASVLIKKFPLVHIAPMNAVAMITGTLIQLSLSILTGERPVLPQIASAWLAQIYLILPGSVLLFAILLFVLKRWTASAVSFQVVLSPILSIALAAWLLGEPLTNGLFVGGALVLVGVYFGAITRTAKDG
jgi:drug/metabolite transporter (DMT)-like permease